MQENRVGYVYNDNRFAGRLVEYITDMGYEYHFSYSESYLQSSAAQLGYNLPLRSGVLKKSFIPTFFANLMSEGWVKRQQEMQAQLDQDDKFGLLLGHGEEIIGPVSIRTELIADNNQGAIFGGGELLSVPIASLKGYTIDFPRKEFNEIAFDSLKGVSISGVQPKMFLTYKDGKKKKLTNAVGMGPFIVKPSPEGLPELAENEYMMMQLCKSVGFNVAEHHLVPFSCGELAYVTGRFDLNRELGKKRDFIEDLASVMDVAPGMKSSDKLSYEAAIKTAYAFAGGHKQILVNGFEQVLMAYIIGNNDLHLKNLSITRSQSSNVASGFTPIYDMVCAAPYRQYDGEELSLWLLESEVNEAFSSTSYSSYGYYTGHDFIVFAEALGLTARFANTIITRLVKRVAAKKDKILQTSPGSDRLKYHIDQRISDRLAAVMRPPIY
ncbi:serine/threonine-protein kinase HipA [Rheinheimera pacifica]|uniref:type II toxin-antitoxin system HipA family toxin n=1 Tax=Rheinheimera pacifica TaxID=173990 RepID=UPI00285DCECE|nr:type II toxin-antitoxin system HipA family toxin [Rheinheimera pacifica]MDR6983161.1 serine/threonine-protein kinase HipA [Rheinheimera pacifica]